MKKKTPKSNFEVFRERLLLCWTRVCKIKSNCLSSGHAFQDSRENRDTAHSSAPQMTAETMISSKAGIRAAQFTVETSETKMKVSREKTANIQIT